MSSNVDSERDSDTFEEDITNVFTEPYFLSEYTSVALDSTYILFLDQNISKENIAVGLSNGNISVYSSEMVHKTTFKVHDEPMTGLKFSPQDPQTVYTSSMDMTVKLWDLRTKNHVRTFFDSSAQVSGGTKKPLTSFSVNCSDRFLAAGTEQVFGEAFLLFWDARSEKLMGGYWDSHNDDVTTLCFHPSCPDRLSSGSTDGIVNIYDLSQSTEDDALSSSLNTESSVQKLKWIGEEELGILTHTEDVKIWNTSDTTPKYIYTREYITKSGLKRALSEMTYTIDIHKESAEDRTLILSGSHCSHNPCLRLSYIKKSKLRPFADLKSSKVRSIMVRCSVMDENNGALFTGGEDGILVRWKPGEETQSPSSKSKFIMKKRNKIKPY